MEDKMFILHWLDGSKGKVSGIDIADACRKGGIGASAVQAIDYYEEIKEQTDLTRR
jgi:hypothetical protein